MSSHSAWEARCYLFRSHGFDLYFSSSACNAASAPVILKLLSSTQFFSLSRKQKHDHRPVATGDLLPLTLRATSSAPAPARFSNRAEFPLADGDKNHQNQAASWHPHKALHPSCLRSNHKLLKHRPKTRLQLISHGAFSPFRSGRLGNPQ